MRKRPIEEIYKDLSKCKSGKEARKLHRELKEYGDGLSFIDRYPNLPLVFSLVSLLFVILQIFLS